MLNHIDIHMFFWIQIIIIIVTIVKFAPTDVSKLYITSNATPNAASPTGDISNGLHSYIAGVMMGLYHCGLITTLSSLTNVSTKTTWVKLFVYEYIARYHLEYCIEKLLAPTQTIVQTIGYINGCMMVMFNFL